MKRIVVTVLFLALALVMSSAFPAPLPEGSSPFIGLAHIQIQTKDLEKSIQFYVGNLDFKVIARSELTRPDGVTKMALVGVGSCVVELAQPAKPETAVEKLNGTIGHYAIEVSDIEKAVAALKAKGVVLDRGIFTMENLFGGIRGAFLSGPSGESIELFQFLKKTQ